MRKLTMPAWVKPLPFAAIMVACFGAWQRDRIVAIVAQTAVAMTGNSECVPAPVAARRRVPPPVAAALIVPPRPAARVVQPKPRIVPADVRFIAVQMRNIRQAARSAPVIAALNQVKPTGDNALDAEAIDNASKTPWANWEAVK